MRKMSMIELLLVCVLITVLILGVSVPLISLIRGELLSTDEIVLKVLFKYNSGGLLQVSDEGSGNVFDIEVSSYTFNMLEVDDLVYSIKRVYRNSKDELTNYYTINSRLDSFIGESELKSAKEVVSENIEVLVTYKYKTSSYNAGTKSTTRRYFIVYREHNDILYFLTERVRAGEYSNINIGDEILAKKSTYIFEDGRRVEKLELLNLD